MVDKAYQSAIISKHGEDMFREARIVELVEKFITMWTLLTPNGIASQLNNAVNGSSGQLAAAAS